MDGTARSLPSPFCFLGEWIYEPRATEERAGQEEEEDSRDEDCTFDRPALCSLSLSWTLPRAHRFVLSTATHCSAVGPARDSGYPETVSLPVALFPNAFPSPSDRKRRTDGRTVASLSSTLHSAGASSPAPPLQHEPVPGAPPSPRILPSGEAEPSLRPRRSCNAAEPACRRRPAGRLAAAEAGVVVGVAAAVPGRGRDEGKGRPGSATGMGWGPSCHRVQLN
jgi:hypothetical protein